MTVTTTTSGPIEFVADGLGTERTIEFQLHDPGDLVVEANGVVQVQGTHYSVSGEYPSQKIVPLSPFWANGVTIRYYRETPRLQEYDIAAGVDIRNESLESELDRQALIDQEQDREAARAVKARRGEAGPVLDPLASLVGKQIGIASDGAGGHKVIGTTNDPIEIASYANQTAGNAAAAAEILEEIEAARDTLNAAIAAASDPDANTETALTASQQALDAVAAYEGPFDPTSSALPAALAARIKRIYFENAKAVDYDVRLYKFTNTSVEIILRDENTQDEVGRVLIATVSGDYSAIPGKRWRILAQDTLSGTPASDPDGANATPILGYIEFADDVSVLDAGTYQPAIGAARVNRRYVRKQRIMYSKHAADDYDEVIEAGPGRTLASVRAASELLLDVPAPTDLTGNYLPQCTRSIGNSIAIVVDPANWSNPGEPWLDQHLFIPPGASLVARHPGSVFYEQPPGATRPIFQLTGDHDLIDINVKNTVADSPLSATSSACYAIHIEDYHLRQTVYPQTSGRDWTQHYRVRLIGGSAVAGSLATIQPIGGAITHNMLVEILGMDLDCEDSAKTFPLISMNNGSAPSIGGGRLRVARCRDLSGRDQTATNNSNNSSVAVQTKAAWPYPNLLELDSNRGFGKIAHTGFGTGGASGAGGWKLQGGNYQGVVYSSIPGDNLGYV